MSNWLSNAGKAPSEDSLALVTRIIQAVDTVKEDIEAMETELKARQEQRNTLESSLADTLSKYGMTELKLKDGRKLTLSEDLKVKLPADPVKRSVVIRFIEAHGGEDIIKDKVTLLNPSKSLMDALVDRGEDFDRKADVNYQTLSAFFREVLGMKKGFAPKVNASDVPEEAGLFMYKKISIR